jgi:hypothetical protein
MEFVVGVGVLVAAAVGWFLYQYSEVQRDLALEKVARRLGMNFRFGLPQELKDVLPRFRLVEDVREKAGEFQAGINSIGGERNGRKIVFFDLQWKTVLYLSTRRRSIWFGGGYDEQPHYRTHRRSAVAAQLGVAVQPVLIRPERLVDKAVALVGYEDIDFTALPDFSRRFYVNSPQVEFARKLVTPNLARFFLDNVTCTVDFFGPWLLLHDNSVARSSNVQELIGLAGMLADLVTREQQRAS